MAIFGRSRRGRHTGPDSDAAYAPDEYAEDAPYDDNAGYADGGYYDESGDEYAGDGPLAGPYDEDEAPDDGVTRLDLGSVRLPLPHEAQVQVEMDPAGPLRAVTRKEVEGMLAACLVRLKAAAPPRKPRRTASAS